MCLAATSDVNAVKGLCNSLGVTAAAKYLCAQQGYGTDTCNIAADDAVQLLGGSCDNVNSQTLGGICQGLKRLEDSTTCEEYGRRDGPALLMGSRTISSLRPHLAQGVTTLDFCNQAGGPIPATVAACNSVNPSDISTVCEEIGAGPACLLYTSPSPRD